MTGGRTARMVHSTQGQTWKRFNSATEHIISRNNLVKGQSWDNLSVVFAFMQTSIATPIALLAVTSFARHGDTAPKGGSTPLYLWGAVV